MKKDMKSKEFGSFNEFNNKGPNFENFDDNGDKNAGNDELAKQIEKDYNKTKEMIEKDTKVN